MRSGLIAQLITANLLLALVCSCAGPQRRPPEGLFYVSAENTYLRDNPSGGANVLGQLYRGDEVKVLNLGESNWWRIELQRSGQKGWVQKELLSPDPIRPVFYYVSEDSLPLLECPRQDCTPLQMLFRGEQVQRVEKGDQGWWRILVLKTRSLGWVPAEALAEKIEEAQTKQLPKPYYYVAVRKLVLRAKPSLSGEVVRTLKFNNQVQRLEESPSGWFKVRQPSTGAVGWVFGPELESLPLRSPRGEPAKEQPKPFRPREAPEVEPEFI